MTAPTTRADAELARAIERLLPITTRDTPDYAEVSFGECQAQAMTMEPDTWLALNQLPALPSEIAALRGALAAAQNADAENDAHLRDRATQAERQRDELRKALPDLFSVIAWLENGCEPKHAVTELSIYKARIDQALANQGADQ